ncbi:MAG: S-layer homology domain-containing protein [Candidatus Margulisbacteria bacterium]|nr:S-layer homology domain-containing protein [Candidatus Margulisiibacteriota bacterium]
MRKFIYLVIFFSVWLCNCSEADYTAIDPTRNIPSARVLGLGKAYIGLADDAASIFTNPAGLNDADDWQVTTMSGKFLEDYGYLSFAGFYPMQYGVLGAGYTGYYIGGVYGTTIESGSDPSDPTYTYDYSQAAMENRNEAVVLSYANDLKKTIFFDRLPFANLFSYGVNAKLFQTSIAGDGIAGGSGLASGQELDFGLKFYPPAKWMKFGAALQNALPSSWGGKLNYAGGYSESYPMVFEAGSVFRIFGDNNSLRQFFNQGLEIMIDLDLHPTISNYPLCWHAGLEWCPVPMLAVRTALDQDAGSDTSGNLVAGTDLAYGVGLNIEGFQLDYAYHTFTGASNIDNQYVSLSYGLLPEGTLKLPLEIICPIDHLVTYEGSVQICGKVNDPNVYLLVINNNPIKFNLRGEFKTDIALNVGKNAVKIVALSEKGQKIVDAKLKALRLVSFPDVPSDYWVAQPVSLLSMQGIMAGYPDGTFKPEGNISRAEMCAVLMKARGLVVSREVAGYLEVSFSDVSPKHWAAKYIDEAVKLGIAKGYADSSFKPAENVDRAEGLAMIARFAGISEEAYHMQFVDVNSRFWAAKIISGASRAGLLDYLAGRPFQPARNLTRSEVVEMLSKTRFMQTILATQILNWDTY